MTADLGRALTLRRTMDHRYIEERSVAERYLDHSLTSPERQEFEAHLVDCQECIDRLLLAEMFHNRNGNNASRAQVPQILDRPETFRVRVARTLSPWQIVLILVIAGALLVLVSSLGVLWVGR